MKTLPKNVRLLGCLNYRILIFQRFIGLQIDYCCPPYLKESNKILRSDGGMANMGRKQPLEGTNGLTAEADEAKNMSRSSDRAESLLYKELASAGCVVPQWCVFSCTAGPLVHPSRPVGGSTGEAERCKAKVRLPT